MEEKSKRGAKLKLTPQVCKDICGGISIGLSLKDASKAAGVSYDTVVRWKRDGKNATEGPQYEFAREFEQAIIDRKSHLLGIIWQAASPKNWTAAAWLLERLHGEEFCKSIKQYESQEQAEEIQQQRAQLRAIIGGKAKANGKQQ